MNPWVTLAVGFVAGFGTLWFIGDWFGNYADFQLGRREGRARREGKELQFEPPTKEEMARVDALMAAHPTFSKFGFSPRLSSRVVATSTPRSTRPSRTRRREMIPRMAPKRATRLRLTGIRPSDSVATESRRTMRSRHANQVQTATNPPGATPDASYSALLAKAGYTCDSWQALTSKQKYLAAQTMMPSDSTIPNAVNQYVNAFDYVCAVDEATRESTQSYPAARTQSAPAQQWYAKASGSVAPSGAGPYLDLDQCEAISRQKVTEAENTIKLTSKNYLVGLAVGGALGAFVMHLYMGGK